MIEFEFLNKMKSIWRYEFKQVSEDSETSTGPAAKRVRTETSEARNPFFDDLFVDAPDITRNDQDELDRYFYFR